MDCPHIPELNYSDFGQRLRERIAIQHVPISGSVELTERCNLQCVHCYINQPAADVVRRTREFTRDEWDSLFKQIVDEGCLWLLMTGGELFVRPDALDIYTDAKKKGLIVTLFTNGTTITPRIAEHLAEWPPFGIEITLYGATEQTYERVSGVPGSYGRCIQGIEYLLDRKLPLKLKTMALTLNQHELPAMQAYAQSLGIEFRFDPLVNCRLDGSSTPSRLRLSPEKVVQLDLADASRMEEWHKFCDKFLGASSDTKHLFVCGAGLGSFHIDAYGQLSACLIARHPSYDLRVGTFRRGWHEFLPTVREQPPPPDYPCNRCELVSLCGQCPGWSQLEHGYGESGRPVEYLHQIAQLRAKAFGLA